MRRIPPLSFVSFKELASFKEFLLGDTEVNFCLSQGKVYLKNTTRRPIGM